MTVDLSSSSITLGDGRILYVTADPALLALQLDGGNLDYTDQALHFGLNTDAMISGGACTLGWTRSILGPHFLLTLTLNGQTPVAEGAVQNGNFTVIVGGDAYGSGSSREVAVTAHRGAGIQLVVANNFQRIFQENMVYDGLLFTTDFGVLKRLQSGEAIPISEFHEALPPFFRTVAEADGLLSFGTQWLNGDVQPWYNTDRSSRPMTVVEKIAAARAWTGSTDDTPTFGLGYVEPGDQVLARCAFRGVHEYTGGMVMDLYNQEWGSAPVHDVDNTSAFEDHFGLITHPTTAASIQERRGGPAAAMTTAMREACAQWDIPIVTDGVCHRVVVEQFANPGDIIVLTDSHTPTAGVMNALAFGVGSTAMSFALRTGMIPVTVPKTVRVEINGNPRHLTPKDVILHLISLPYFREEQWRSSPTDTCVIQFGGNALQHWTVAELSVLTNMTVEGGLMTGVVEPCQPIVNFLKEQRGLAEEVIASMLVYPDQGATYVREMILLVEDIPVTVASPGDSRNGVNLTHQLTERSPFINNVVVASCTGGSADDIKAFAAVMKGRTFKPGITVTITPSSQAAAEEAAEALEFLRTLGANVTPPGCGACIGNGPGSPLPGGDTASTTNRNFPKRMGAPGDVWLVSPAVAAACAITGQLTDPRWL